MATKWVYHFEEGNAEIPDIQGGKGTGLAIMSEFNRRRFPRENTEDPIQVILIPDNFEGPEDSGDQIQAKMVNQSDNGLFLAIDRDLAPGAMVRIKKILKEDTCFEEVCYIRDGQVIRCEVLNDAGSHFGIGVKILRKVIQGHILTSHLN